MALTIPTTFPNLPVQPYMPTDAITAGGDVLNWWTLIPQAERADAEAAMAMMPRHGNVAAKNPNGVPQFQEYAIPSGTIKTPLFEGGSQTTHYRGVVPELTGTVTIALIAQAGGYFTEPLGVHLEGVGVSGNSPYILWACKSGGCELQLKGANSTDLRPGDSAAPLPIGEWFLMETILNFETGDHRIDLNGVAGNPRTLTEMPIITKADPFQIHMGQATGSQPFTNGTIADTILFQGDLADKAATRAVLHNYASRVFGVPINA
ncbi:hypothetical protein [Paracoccus onubensis]|uniref:Uncharacterized protein n=1 Tax=Paracoccus onubensis TaxID=1675788 RepID=A0A418T1V8_9RHOB|nr:hypothetical protein [Paracoccus onubensis]RJE87143.1 hypothetical protein D3P04_05180 [Paracoccus onubensis]